jgi:tryptophan-rich sensory protein
MFFANQVALLLGAFAFVWAKFAPTPMDWKWYDAGVDEMPQFFQIPRWAFAIIWALLDIFMALYAFFAYAPYLTSGANAECDPIYIANVCMYILLMIACKLYTPVFLVRGNKIGGMVLTILIAILSLIVSATYLDFFGVKACLPSDYYGYRIPASIFTWLFTTWAVYAAFMQFFWHYRGLPTPTSMNWGQEKLLPPTAADQEPSARRIGKSMLK